MKLLIANRGEIAIRVSKTAKKIGFKTVGIVAPFETNFYYLQFMDEVIELEGVNLLETFLNINQIISIAKKNRCKLLHPGYGFLAENPDFAKACEENNITFIGPSPATLTLAQDKLLCKKKAIECGINSIPFVEDKKDLFNFEFPVMIKAKKGGGGKGLRKVSDKNLIEEEIAKASREAKVAFGDESVFFEQFIDKPKHIEAQFVADKFGEVVFLGTRDCSVQRRHQKILEEAPAVALNNKNHENIYSSTKKLVRAINYLGCGTVEFLYKDNNLFFMEINPRIQVEHTVTEEVTGLDIIELQISSVLGEKLNDSLENCKKHGFSMELRICAEDPYNNFQPQTGYIEKIFLPASNKYRNNFRWDTGITERSFISAYFDSLLGKFIVSGQDRKKTINTARELLKEFGILGVQTNISIFKALFKDKNYLENNIYPSYLDENLDKILQIKRENIIAGYLSFWAQKNYTI
ncbi:MAG: biotin carboxylase N-terminal domain-containing protein [Planctomycetota bacterium]